MAPSLYVIVVDAMKYILKSTEFGPPIKGISFPNNDELLVDQFADDTILFVNMEEENFDRVVSRIELFAKHLVPRFLLINLLSLVGTTPLPLGLREKDGNDLI